MSTQQSEQRRQKFEQMDYQQVSSQIQSLPLQTIHEGNYALQQVRELVDSQQVSEIVEPLAKVIGWAEALTFAFSQTESSKTTSSN